MHAARHTRSWPALSRRARGLRTPSLRSTAGASRVGLVLLLAAVGLGVGVAAGLFRGARPHDVAAWRPRIVVAARAANVDPHLLEALLAVESGGDPRAVSRAGALGLLQLMPTTAAEEATRQGLAPPDREQLFEPELNLRLGASYLKRMLDRFDGDEAFAVAAYNAGPTRVMRWRAKAVDLPAREVVAREGFAETRRHVHRVLEAARRLRERASATLAP